MACTDSSSLVWTCSVDSFFRSFDRGEIVAVAGSELLAVIQNASGEAVDVKFEDGEATAATPV